MNSIPFYSFAYQNLQIKDAYHAFTNRFFEDQEYILGNQLSSFEYNFSNYLKTNFTIGVGNGHDALFLALKALNIGKGDDVIVPANTFVATALAVINCGANLILIDCDSDTFNIQFSELEIRSNTKAIIPVHLFGSPVDMDACMSFASKNKIQVIEDFAQAHGATYNDIKVGSFGICNATSFYPIKPLGAIGDGGAVVTNSEKLANTIKALRNYGSIKKYSYESIGINSRLDDFQAGILNLKLSFLNQWNNERITIAQIYKSLLNQVGDITFQVLANNAKSVYHIFAISTERRDLLKAYLEEKGIFTQIHYPIPFHLQQPFEFLKIKKGQLKNTEKLASTLLSLPIYPGLSLKQVEYICDTIKSFFSNR
jgi:dTDP-4-amino-4,6-dideoxygalactose transaminase